MEVTSAGIDSAMSGYWGRIIRARAARGSARSNLGFLPLQAPHDEDEADDRDVEEGESHPELPEHDLADPEERGVDEDDPEDPVNERHRAAGDRLAPETEAPRDRFPARPARAHAPVERVEGRLGLGFREERDGDPDDGRDGDGEQHDDRLDAELLGAVSRIGLWERIPDERDARHRDDHRGEHRRNLAPGVDAPPVPAEDEDEAGTAPEREEEPPRALDRREVHRHDDGQEKEQDRGL